MNVAEKSDEKRVLVVDDEETVCIGISEILKDAGYDAAYATSGRDALKAVEGADYSLIFMDMIMPMMNGLETFRKIKSISPRSRVVLFTGYFKDADKAIYQGVKEGMIDEYIRKPFFAEEIVHAARKHTGRGTGRSA